jgi:hypothetical protein
LEESALDRATLDFVEITFGAGSVGENGREDEEKSESLFREGGKIARGSEQTVDIGYLGDKCVFIRQKSEDLLDKCKKWHKGTRDRFTTRKKLCELSDRPRRNWECSDHCQMANGEPSQWQNCDKKAEIVNRNGVAEVEFQVLGEVSCFCALAISVFQAI